jgi:hypothetical protein
MIEVHITKHTNLEICLQHEANPNLLFSPYFILEIHIYTDQLIRMSHRYDYIDLLIGILTDLI